MKVSAKTLILVTVLLSLFGCGSGGNVGSGPEAQAEQQKRDEYNRKNNVGTEP